MTLKRHFNFINYSRINILKDCSRILKELADESKEAKKKKKKFDGAKQAGILNHASPHYGRSF